MNIKCNNCNSGILKKKDDYYECEYCGSKIKIEDTKKEVVESKKVVNNAPVETVTHGEEPKSSKIVAFVVGFVIALAFIIGVCWTAFGSELMHDSLVESNENTVELSSLKVSEFFGGCVELITYKL